MWSVNLKKEKVRKSRKDFKQLKKEYLSLRKEIVLRLEEFRQIWNAGTEEDIFYELIFCIMTPQSKAELCWAATERIRKKDIKKIVTPKEIQDLMTGVRFKYKKSGYILEARDKFLKDNDFTIKSELSNLENVSSKRIWLLKNVKGIGFKEAAHFLRNIGFGEEIAILDRHILKNLEIFGAISSRPVSLTGEKYISIENKMKAFAKDIGIPLDHLDLLFWFREAGKIFK